MLGLLDTDGMHSFLEHPEPIAFPHRGGAGEAPENTLAAFEVAVTLGYGYLETDTHLAERSPRKPSGRCGRFCTLVGFL